MGELAMVGRNSAAHMSCVLRLKWFSRNPEDVILDEVLSFVAKTPGVLESSPPHQGFWCLLG